MASQSESRPARPRIVFFGPPNAGKTALLTAFLRIANSDDEIRLTPAGSASRDVVSNTAAGCVLVDTDGKTAASLIADPGRFRPRPVRRELASVTAAVYAADALVLLIDASADHAELDQLFRDFGKFLEKLEEAQTVEREPGPFQVTQDLQPANSGVREPVAIASSDQPHGGHPIHEVDGDSGTPCGFLPCVFGHAREATAP